MKRQRELIRRAEELVTYFDAFSHRFMLREGLGQGDEVALTRQERRVVGTIGGREAWSMGGLARHLMLAVSSLTGVIDKLVAKGLVARARSEEDRRTVWVRLTPPGRRRYERFRRKRFRIARDMLAALDEAEQPAFLVLMRKIGQGSAEEYERGARKTGGRQR